MDHLLAIVPSVLALGLFIVIIRLMINADRLEREADEKMAAREADKNTKLGTNSPHEAPTTMEG